MNQFFRICLYYVLIGGIAWLLVQYVPFKLKVYDWSLLNKEESILEDLDSLPIEFPDTVLATIIPDSLLRPVVNDTVSTIAVVKDATQEKNHLICPPKFLAQLTKFHNQLINTHNQKRNIRILHYGDSQIEGDRITAYLRENFQQRFGGSGPGLTTVFDPQRINPSVWLTSDGSWSIHAIYDRYRQLEDKAYGLMGQVSTLKENSIGHLKISASPWARKHARHYQKVRLFIAPHTDSLFIKGHIKSTEVINDSLPPSVNLTEINWEFAQLSPSLNFELESKNKVHIFGCALDSISGVTVDNLALRGQSSPLLHKTNGELFKAMGEHLNIGMIVFQFGTNIIPTVASNYHFYKVQLSRQFRLLKQYLPDVPVIVVGISDAARQVHGEIVAYEHLSRIRDTQKAISKEYGFAFFDLYEAMGGKGSIIKWANHKPTWALSDYIHFTRKGGQEVARLLTTELWQHFDEITNHPTDSLALKN